MTSVVMQRPRSTQPGDLAAHSSDQELYRSGIGGDGGVPRMSSMTGDNNGSANTATTSGMFSAQGSNPVGGIASPPALGMLGGEIDRAFRGFLLDPSSSSSAAAEGASAFSNALHDGSGEHASSSSLTQDEIGGARGIFDDPAILALVDQPFDPSIDFELDLQQEALAADLSQQHQHHSQQTPGLVPQSYLPSHSQSAGTKANPLSEAGIGVSAAMPMASSSASSIPPLSSSASIAPPLSSNAHKVALPQSNQTPLIPDAPTATQALPELNLTSVGGNLQFPELPASLLDQAPEYEYSMHTQANVFDSVQDYQGTGDEDAARIFGLDNYDPNLGLTRSAADVSSQGGMLSAVQANQDDLWRYNDSSVITSHGADPSSGSSFGQHGLHSGDGFGSTFADTSSMISSSEYPVEPSSAPTSRSSEWKVDAAAVAAAGGAMGNNGVLDGVQGGGAAGYADQAPPNAKRRRESSFDSRAGDSMGASSLMAPPSGHHGAFVTPSSNSIYSAHGMPIDTRLSSAPQAASTAAATNGRFASREPMVPSQGAAAPRSRLQSWHSGDAGSLQQRMPTSDGWQSQMQEAQTMYGQGASGAMLNGHGSYGLSNSLNAAGGPTDGQGMMMMNGSEVHAMNTNIARTEMINAIGSAMDASLESDGVAKCPYPNCSKTFAKNRSYNLKAHLRSHSQLKPFQCIHCPRAFSRKHDLERHTRVHSGDKPYLCEACGKGFPRSDALRRHWRVEKECGDKAVEIEAKTPLPSLPPGVNTPAAQAKGPIPGLMHFGAPTTTAAAMNGMGMAVGGPGVNPFLPVHAGHHPGMHGVAASAHPGWESSMPTVNPYANAVAAAGMANPYQAVLERKKRSRDD